MTTRMETRVEGLEKAMEEHNTRLGAIENQLRDQAAYQPTEFEQLRANQYFLVHNTPAERRVQVALIALAGPAMAWVQVLLRRSPLITWDDFSRELQIRFGTRVALDEYEALHTTIQVGSLNDYISSFESQLAQLPDLTERQYLSFFLGGLKPQIRMQIKDPNIAHYTDAIQMAKRIVFLENPSEYNTQLMISHQPRDPSVARKEKEAHMLAVMGARTNSSQAKQGPLMRRSGLEKRCISAASCMKINHLHVPKKN
ncbi:hypothetical protein SASPL_104219 [Salvia splendens]|uniref:Retrotransposon gag domain-containing protein n=1 Tax=Salvia splendens TaxID=180675 RepID=A0A8X8YH57_SALSN|nr:hypothetical protein SASPL_104219 [Salvia splendens]